MTTVAWDGETLAADKMTVNYGMPRSCTKIRKIHGHLVFGCGKHSTVMKFFDWFEMGRGVFPECPDTSLYVITPDKRILVYEAEIPYEVEELFFACGSGRDFAVAAMHLGKNAVEAVEIAALFDINTGRGVDTLKL